MGDFNLHSPEWDNTVQSPSDSARNLLNRTTTAGLVLLNTDDQPTWSQPNRLLRTLDLCFAHADMFEKYAPDLDVDLANRGPGDHAGLTLTFLRLDESPSLKRAIPRDSEEYQAFIADATNAWIEVDFNDLPSPFLN